MAGQLPNISTTKLRSIHRKPDFKIGIAVSAWNAEITDKLLQSALHILSLHHFDENQIEITQVPGSYELPIAARWLIDLKQVAGVICLGCIIKGDTDHDKYIAQAVADGIMNVSLNYGIPVSFGVLTTNTKLQALERAGGKYGNKGEEAALGLLHMIQTKIRLAEL